LGESLSESKVLNAFKHMSTSKIEEGYSARTAAGRQQLLEDAKEWGIKMAGKKVNEKTRGIDVPYHLVPGALSLLAQVVLSQLGYLVIRE